MTWLNKNIVRAAVTGEEYILHYDRGKVACAKVVPYTDPFIGFAQTCLIEPKSKQRSKERPEWVKEAMAKVKAKRKGIGE